MWSTRSMPCTSVASGRATSQRRSWGARRLMRQYPQEEREQSTCHSGLMRQRVCQRQRGHCQPTCCPFDGQAVLDSLSAYRVVALDRMERCLKRDAKMLA